VHRRTSRKTEYHFQHYYRTNDAESQSNEPRVTHSKSTTTSFHNANARKGRNGYFLQMVSFKSGRQHQSNDIDDDEFYSGFITVVYHSTTVVIFIINVSSYFTLTPYFYNTTDNNTQHNLLVIGTKKFSFRYAFDQTTTTIQSSITIITI
jgi:hypothetical protein